MSQHSPITAHWHYPTEVYFGPGELKRTPTLLHQLAAASPLIVLDSRLKSEACIEELLLDLNQSGLAYQLFSAFSSNPTDIEVNKGAAIFVKHHCDTVVAIGGGSTIDVAKTIALTVNQQYQLWDFIDQDDNYLRADSALIPPIIAIPTTAGTGSEVGRAALITDASTHDKQRLFHPKMLPSMVICDPLLSISLPPNLTAATGLDALTHNIEALCAPGYHPLADGIALEGIRLVKDNLLRATSHGDDVNARGNMLAASLMGATAFQKGLGAVHSLSHPIGGLFDSHHGLLNAIFLPYVLQFNQPVIEPIMVRLARHLELDNQSTTAVIDWLLTLCAELNIPNNLQAIGIGQQHTELIVQRAMADPSTLTNPRPLTAQACLQLFEAAWHGDISRIM